jgi:hypothetical protein
MMMMNEFNSKEVFSLISLYKLFHYLNSSTNERVAMGNHGDHRFPVRKEIELEQKINIGQLHGYRYRKASALSEMSSVRVKLEGRERAEEEAIELSNSNKKAQFLRFWCSTCAVSR